MHNANPYMTEALLEAEKAAQKGEVPVGAVIVYNNQIIARAHNLSETNHNATHHAELLAIWQAMKTLKDSRLADCDLYVTLEPCSMCAGAIILSRLKRLYFGAYDKKAGAAGSVLNLFNRNLYPLNHQPEVYEGIMESACSKLLTEFFEGIRDKNAF